MMLQTGACGFGMLALTDLLSRVYAAEQAPLAPLVK